MLLFSATSRMNEQPLLWLKTDVGRQFAVASQFVTVWDDYECIITKRASWDSIRLGKDRQTQPQVHSPTKNCTTPSPKFHPPQWLNHVLNAAADVQLWWKLRIIPESRPLWRNHFVASHQMSICFIVWNQSEMKPKKKSVENCFILFLSFNSQSIKSTCYRCSSRDGIWCWGSKPLLKVYVLSWMNPHLSRTKRVSGFYVSAGYDRNVRGETIVSNNCLKRSVFNCGFWG